jgi:hypothetical protein
VVFKVGDKIRRKDMPALVMEVIAVKGDIINVGVTFKQPMETDVYGYQRKPKKSGIIYADDDRWELAN